MQVTEHLHAVKIPFKIPIAPDRQIDRVVYVFLVIGAEITLIDSGVAGAERLILDYLNQCGRRPSEVARLILSHSHPDHVGAARAIQQATGCAVWAHQGERAWIEDTERQGRERPVPGFNTLVGGPVAVDRVLADGDSVALGDDIRARVIHTPGHSRGSISLLFASDRAMFTGDAIPLPHDLPIYERIADCVGSLATLRREETAVHTLLSSWEAPIQGREAIANRIDSGLAYLRAIHEQVLTASANGAEEPMALCRQVVSALGLPPFAAMPLVARALASSIEAKALFAPGSDASAGRSGSALAPRS